MNRISPGPTSAGPVVCVEDVAKAAGAVVAANVVVAIVVTGQLFVLPLRTFIYICGDGRASQSTNPCMMMKTIANIYRKRSLGC